MKIGLLTLVIVFIAGGLFYLQNKAITSPTSLTSQPLVNISPSLEVKNDKLKTYTSKDLKISFKYPKDWNIDDRYQMILITNYATSLNRDDKPSDEQLEILMKSFSGCHETIEENLKDPACGEGGKSVKKNQILSKETKQINDGTFYKYIVQTPNTKLTFYLIEKGDRVLQISKQPDPSQFEKEFEDIINSIEFI